MIVYFCDECGREMLQPLWDATCFHHAFECADGMKINIAYQLVNWSQGMNKEGEKIHFCAACLIKRIGEVVKSRKQPAQPRRIENE